MPKRMRFKHMFGREADIWGRWLEVHGKGWDKFEYDVHVGQMWPEHLDLPVPWRQGAEGLYLKRIDVVGFTGDEITIFEVKPHAGLGALGQVMGYLALYEEQFAPSQELKGAIVTELADPNIRRILEQNGIELFIIPPKEG